MSEKTRDEAVSVAGAVYTEALIAYRKIDAARDKAQITLFVARDALITAVKAGRPYGEAAAIYNEIMASAEAQTATYAEVVAAFDEDVRTGAAFKKAGEAR